MICSIKIWIKKIKPTFGTAGLLKNCIVVDFHKNLSYGFLIPLLNAVNGNASKLFLFS